MAEAGLEHLSPSQIMQMADGEGGAPSIVEHLKGCAGCQSRLREWKESLAFLAPLRASVNGDCPSLEDLAVHLAEPQAASDSEISRHIGSCPRCSALAEITAAPDSEALSLLYTSSPEWRREMVARFSPRPAPRRAYRWLAAAAALVIVLGGAAWWRVASQPKPEVLLARAYTAARPFEYWLPDDGYAPVRQSRGPDSSGDESQPLIEAEAELGRQLAARPDNARALALKGRARLIANRYGPAIESLQRAHDLNADDREITTDLAIAYVLRGQVEKQNLDYGRALNLLLAVLRLEPANQRAWFNIALVYEELAMYDQAVAAWRKLIDLKPPAGWLGEARTRLDELETKRRAKAGIDRDILRDAASFVAARNNGAAFDPDPYHETFWQAWLPAATSDGNAKDAATAEAQAFAERFHDSSLRDALIEAAGLPAERRQPALAALAQAISFNQKGQADRAADAARAAAATLTVLGAHVAALRARMELAYAERRAARIDRCLDLTAEVLRDAGPKHYAWLAGYAHAEHATCEESAGHSGIARAELAASQADLQQAGLRLPALRALGLITSTDNEIGNYAAVWDNAPSGRAAWWTGPASVYRLQQFQYDLQGSAAALDWVEAAAVFGRAAADSARRAGNPEMEAADRVELASLLVNPGDTASKEFELRSAQKLILQLPPGPTRDDLEWTLRLEQTSAKVRQGRAREAAGELQQLAAHTSEHKIDDQVRLHQIRGLALAAAQAWKEAGAEFEQVIAWNQTTVASLHSWSERSDRLESAAESYRMLAEIDLVQRHDPVAALAVWQKYRGASESPKGSAADPVIIYAVLPSGIAVWSNVAGSVRARVVSVPLLTAQSEVRRFASLCASSASSEEEIKRTGNRLYRWLIESELNGLPKSRVRLETDSWLSSIPFGALTDDSGHYLSRSRSFENVPGAAGPGHAPTRRITADSRMFIIAAPTGRTPGRTQLPFLAAAGREAASVARRFMRPVILEGDVATTAEIGLNSARAEVFHFVGHGWANGRNGALILPPARDGETRFITARELGAQNWSRCSLAVLSACLTAAGEQRGSIENQSLVGALLGAGAQTVVAARWSVDSQSTAALMEHFYGLLLAGHEPAEALALASSGVAAVSGWGHPYYWGGFDVFGKS